MLSPEEMRWSDSLRPSLACEEAVPKGGTRAPCALFTLQHGLSPETRWEKFLTCNIYHKCTYQST